MRFFRLDLLTLLISLFLFSNCKNTDTVGLPVDASQQASGVQIVDNSVSINTLLEDSVVTSALAKTPLAYFKDPVFGTTEANVAAGIDPPSDFSLPIGTLTTDSAVLILPYSDGFYGDSLNSTYKINVYQLAEQPLSSTTYYNNKAWQHNSTLLGSRNFKAYTHTSFKITDIVNGQPDTLKKVSPQLRVPISTAFINNNIFNASSSQLSNSALFQSALKGLYLTLDQNQTGVGGNLMLNLNTGAEIDVYYKTVNGSIIDTGMTKVPLTAAAHAAQIKHTFSSAVLNAVNSKASNNVVYLQGGATKAKISFDNLSTVFGTTNLKNIVINRAELVLTPVNGTSIPYVPAPKLSIYTNNIGGQPTLLPDANKNYSPYFQSVGIFGGYYSQTLLTYNFLVTGFLQGLLHGTFPDYGTYIVPVDTTNTTTVDISPTAQTQARSVLVGSDASSAYKIRLNVIYTKTNQ